MKFQTMRRSGWPLVVLSIFCLSASPAFADDDDDDDDDDAFSPVAACGTVIDTPGSYRLVNDLVDCNEFDPRGITYGVAIASNDVVLDFGGHTIRCLNGEGAFEFGVFTEPFLSNVQIKNGTIQGCDLAVNLNQGDHSAVRGMTLKGNGTGIEVLGGADNKVMHNRILGSEGAGVFATSFFFDTDVGTGSRHKIHKNLVMFGGGPGIDANRIEDTVISCNRSERNSEGLLVVNTGLNNKITRNVANNNEFLGIWMAGFDFRPFFFGPIAEGNTVKRNSAMGNGVADVAEAWFGFRPDGPPGLFEADECKNTWKGNAYGTQFALEGCIAPSVRVKDDDDDEGCAPRMEFDEADDENALKDPGFEMRLRPDEGGWLLFGASWFNFEQVRSGHQSMFNGAEGFVSGAFQELPAMPGSQWRMTGFGLTPAPIDPGFTGDLPFGIVQVSFFDADGNDLGTLETMPGLAKISEKVDDTSPAGEWIFLDTGVATAPPGTVTIQAFTLYVDFSGAPFQGVYFDDLNLCALDSDGECEESDDDDDGEDDDDDEEDDD